MSVPPGEDPHQYDEHYQHELTRQRVDPASYQQQYAQNWDQGSSYTQPAPQKRGSALIAFLWVLVGVVIASALWGGGLALFHGGSSHPKADTAGYHVVGNLCSTIDLSAFQSAYTKDTSPKTHTVKTKSFDQMTCDQDLEAASKSSDSAGTGYLYVVVMIHRKSDPGIEFGDNWRSYSQFDHDYTVKPVSGFGDEAYLVTNSSTDDPSVQLAVRDGWVTYSMQWTAYYGSSGTHTPTPAQVTDWIERSTRASMLKLQ